MPTATFGASVGATGGLVTLTGIGLQVMGGAIQAYQGNIQPLVSAGYQAAATGLESLEPISKLLEQDAKGCRLHEAEKIGRVVLPANEEPPLPLHPSEEALNYPTSLVAAQTTTVLSLLLDPVRAMRRDHFDPRDAQFRIQLVAVVRAITDQIVRLCFNCVIHAMSVHGFTACRSSISRHAGHRFQAMSVHRFTACRSSS